MHRTNTHTSTILHSVRVSGSVLLTKRTLASGHRSNERLHRTKQSIQHIESSQRIQRIDNTIKRNI